MQNRRGRYFWRAIIISGIVIFALNSAIFVILGQANADEGWYLYASKLVYEGKFPYQDFAFTQAPLLPYIYGAPQSLFLQSIYLGRTTSVVFSMIAFVLSLKVARNYGGEMASGITALLGATFTYGIYFQSITKTYALTTLFFILAFFMLSSRLQQDFRVLLATIFVLLATLTRLSAVFFAIPFIIYAFLVSNTKTRLILITFGFAASFWILILALHNVDAVTWGLVTHHTSQWGNTSFKDRVVQIFDCRIPSLLRTFSLYVLLWITILSMGFRYFKNNIGSYSAIPITTLGLLLFSIPNLLSGGFCPEYFVPFIFVSFPIIAIAHTKILDHRGNYSKAFMNVVLLSSMVLGFIHGGLSFIDISVARDLSMK